MKDPKKESRVKNGAKTLLEATLHCFFIEVLLKLTKQKKSTLYSGRQATSIRNDYQDSFAHGAAQEDKKCLGDWNFKVQRVLL